MSEYGEASTTSDAPAASADVAPIVESIPVPEVSAAPEPTPPESIPPSPAPVETPPIQPVPSAPASAPEIPPAQSTPPPTQSVQEPSIKSRLGAAFEALRFKKRKKLDKILQLAAKKGGIKNDDVEKLLRVSDASATNYLNQLIKEGRLKRLGSAAHATYEPV